MIQDALSTDHSDCDRDRFRAAADDAGDRSMSRRVMLKSLALAGLGSAMPATVFAQSDIPTRHWREAVRAYLESLSRPDGGYAWEDQPDSHLTPTYAVIGCYRVMGLMPPNKGALAEFVRTHHPSRLKQLEQEHRVFDFQQVQSLIWLGEDASAFGDPIRARRQPVAYLKQYERHGNPVFQSEAAVFLCRELLGLPMDELRPVLTDYLDARRRANGSFNNTPAGDGGDGQVMNTWWGLQALRPLGRLHERRAETIQWLRGCQLPSGGFTYQPKPEFGGVEDVVYTWAAVRALKLLGAEAVHRDACVAQVRSLANHDGGFAGRPGWASNPMTTYYALEALAALDGLDSVPATRRAAAAATRSLRPGLKVFSIQIEAHGQGSPAEAVELARALRIHLWGAKNAKPEWMARAQALANRQKVPVQFFVSNEEHVTWVNVPGLGTYSHTSDIMAPAGADFGPSLAGPAAVSWPEYRARRLTPLWKGNGRLIWQFGENEELVRMLLDDSLQRDGYAAISTFHFGNPDFTNSEPFLNCYRGQLPFVALQDAHGTEPWWFADMTTGFRTVFLATEPTWDGWLSALRENRVVAIRHDAVSGHKTWFHGGSREVLDFVREHELEWRWWDNPAIQRPLVSVAAITPEDEFETARPAQGVMIRVRCAWENTTQGLPKRPLVELVRLAVDDAVVSPTLAKTAVARPRQALVNDHYHQFHLPDPAPGKHTVEATVRQIETGAESSRRIEFTLG